ncbi:hypothetical protein INR49_022213 [Caranx melampygus]|nr:hypothetical protein INR49_022213 [Caranx melampygus]
MFFLPWPKLRTSLMRPHSKTTLITSEIRAPVTAAASNAPVSSRKKENKQLVEESAALKQQLAARENNWELEKKTLQDEKPSLVSTPSTTKSSLDNLQKTPDDGAHGGSQTGPGHSHSQDDAVLSRHGRVRRDCEKHEL